MNVLDCTNTISPLNATAVTPWYDTRSVNNMGIALHTAATGSPVGTWSFQGSNDSRVQGLKASGAAPSLSDGMDRFNLTVSQVHGDALAVIGGVAFNTYVAFSDGLPRFIRAVFTYSSGGSSSSTATARVSGRE